MIPYAADPRDLAAELSPTVVSMYLVSQGYRPIGYHEIPSQPLASVAMFNRDGAQPQMAIEVPLNPDLRDYGRRMHEALDALDGPFLGLLHAIDPDRFPRERILLLAGVTFPPLVVEGAVVYLRNDLRGAPLALLGELSQLIGKGSIRTDADKTAAPPVPGYRPWAVVTFPPLVVEGDFVYLRADLDGVETDVFAALTETIGRRHIRADGDLRRAPAVLGYRVFMALAPDPYDPEEVVKDP